MDRKVEKIILSDTEPPHGFYHITICYNEQKGDMWTVAHLFRGEFGLEEAESFAQNLADKYQCPLENTASPYTSPLPEN